MTTVTSVISALQSPHGFNGAAFVHRLVAFGHLVDGQGQLEDVAGLALVVEHALHQVGRETTHRGRATEHSLLLKEELLSVEADATGHKTLALVQRYTEAAGREGMADSAIEKLVARPNGERNLANLPKRFVKSDTNPKQGKDNL